MSKCLTPIQLLHAMAEPAAPENAAIMAHLYVCDKCLNALREWRKEIDEAEYVPQPGDDEAAEKAVSHIMKQKDDWKRLWNTCRDFFSQFKEFTAFCPPQAVYAGARRQTAQVRKITEPPVFHFASRRGSYDYAWNADMTFPVPGKTAFTDICININFSASLPEGAKPQSFHFQDKELQLEIDIDLVRAWLDAVPEILT